MSKTAEQILKEASDRTGDYGGNEYVMESCALSAMEQYKDQELSAELEVRKSLLRRIELLQQENERLRSFRAGKGTDTTVIVTDLTKEPPKTNYTINTNKKPKL